MRGAVEPLAPGRPMNLRSRGGLPSGRRRIWLLAGPPRTTTSRQPPRPSGFTGCRANVGPCRLSPGCCTGAGDAEISASKFDVATRTGTKVAAQRAVFFARKSSARTVLTTVGGRVVPLTPLGAGRRTDRCAARLYLGAGRGKSSERDDLQRTPPRRSAGMARSRSRNMVRHEIRDDARH